MKKYLVGLVAGALLASILLIGQSVVAQSDVSNFSKIKTDAWLQSGTYTKVGTFLRTTPASTVVVSQDSVITPTASYQPISSAGTVATASIVAGTAGDILLLVNTSNTSITISDTGTLKLASTRALGQFDTLTLQSDGTNWIERAYSNN